MIETNYRIIEEFNRFTVMNVDSTVSKGSMSIKDALHSIWTINGKEPSHWYGMNEDGLVYIEVV